MTDILNLVPLPLKVERPITGNVVVDSDGFWAFRVAHDNLTHAQDDDLAAEIVHRVNTWGALTAALERIAGLSPGDVGRAGAIAREALASAGMVAQPTQSEPAQAPRPPMNDIALAALRASIEKWEGNLEAARAALRERRPIRRGAPAQPGESCAVILTRPDDCGLCNEFFFLPGKDGGEYCVGCPVGTPLCHDTPYMTVCELIPLWEVATTAEMVEAVADEVAFLKSLLPAEAPT